MILFNLSLSWCHDLQALEHQLDVDDTNSQWQARQKWHGMEALEQSQYLDQRPVDIVQVLEKAPADDQCCRIQQLDRIPAPEPPGMV